jgi:hypothetical protein
MPSLSITRHPSAAASPLRVTQARLRVLRRIVFAAAQVAALTAIRTTGIAPSSGSRNIITGPGINPFDAAMRNATGTLQ